MDVQCLLHALQMGNPGLGNIFKMGSIGAGHSHNGGPKARPMGEGYFKNGGPKVRPMDTITYH